MTGRRTEGLSKRRNGDGTARKKKKRNLFFKKIRTGLTTLGFSVRVYLQLVGHLAEVLSPLTVFDSFFPLVGHQLG
ncbi:MAG: hypothetical protein V3S29_04990, partial [bacterium]